jgi:hypothetical protein
VLDGLRGATQVVHIVHARAAPARYVYLLLNKNKINSVFHFCR